MEVEPHVLEQRRQIPVLRDWSRSWALEKKEEDLLARLDGRLNPRPKGREAGDESKKMESRVHGAMGNNMEKENVIKR